MKAQIRAFIERTSRTGPDPAGFEALALELFAWQLRKNPDYAAIASGTSPTRVDEIPAVPVPLFRALSLTCFNWKHALYLFHTSGTTSARPGVHRLKSTDLYDLAAKSWFQTCVPQAPERCVSLIPEPIAAPHSSLAHMIGSLYPEAQYFVRRDGRMDAKGLCNELSGARSPQFIATTAFALAEFFHHPVSQDLELPEGSVLMVTGGFKGRKTELSLPDLYRLARKAWGQDLRIVGEYGMTELSSQLWREEFEPYAPPPWMRVIAVAPGTGVPLSAGQAGQLRFVDLANHQTVLAIETLDQGRVLSDGRVELLGRLAGAPVRGCSLTREDALVEREGSEV